MTSLKHVIQVILAGDPTVGKTSLARTITEGGFPTADSVHNESDTCPTYHCRKDTTITAGDYTYSLDVLDPSTEDDVMAHLGQVDFCYLCFDVIEPESSASVKKRWLPLVTKATKAKIILVGLKSDQSKDRIVTLLRGQNMANEIKAVSYVEVSSLKYIGIQELKERTVFEYEKSQTESQTKKKRCVLM